MGHLGGCQRRRAQSSELSITVGEMWLSQAAALVLLRPRLLVLATVGPDDTAASLTPRWVAPRPDYEKPDAGLPLVTGAEHVVIFTPEPEDGTYNHGAQIVWHEGAFSVAWNNAAYNEDQDGMRVLLASAADGRSWSRPVELWPPMPASQFGCTAGGSFCWDKVHHHALPFVTLNGRLYAVSSLHRHQLGAYFYPVPAGDLNTTLLRRVLQPARKTPGGCAVGITPSGACPADSLRWLYPAFGPMLWATDVVPYGMENVTRAFGIRPALPSLLTHEEVADLALFRDNAHARLYSSESCRAGPCGPRMGEQTVYSVKDSSTDVILYRGTGGSLPAGWPGDQACANETSCVLLSSSRDTSEPLASHPWTPVVPTNIPDLGSNLNAGSFSDGRVWLVWNGVPRPHINDTQCNRLSPVRNPLTLAISSHDGGRTFDKVWALYNSTRPKRYCGSAKPFGPSYPQAAVVHGEGDQLDGLWATYSINKEEVGVTFAPIGSLE